MVSIGEGATAAVQAQIATFGTNVIAILPGAITPGGVWTGHGGAGTLTVKDMEEAGKGPYERYGSWARRESTPGRHEKKKMVTNLKRGTPAPFFNKEWSLKNRGLFHHT